VEDRCLLSSYNLPIDLGTLGASNLQSSATAITNSTGQVVGSAQTVAGDPSALHPFLWTAGGTDGVPSNPQMKDLGSLVAGGNGWATDINDSGQVVGWSDSGQFDASGKPIQHAILWQNGSMTDLRIPMGGNDLTINNSAVVVGDEETTAGPSHAFVWDRDHGVRDLNNLVPSNLGAELRQASAANNQGQIVADGPVGSTWHAYLLSDNDHDGDFKDTSEVIDLGALGNGTDASASAINDVAQVSGKSGTDAFLWQNGHMKDLGQVNGATAFPTGINLSGYVVGTCNVPLAWIWTGSGKIKDLSGLIPSHSGWSFSAAWGINDAGKIVGYGTPPSGGATHAFLLTPTASSGAAVTAPSAALQEAKTPGLAPVEALVLDNLAHWLNAGVQGKRTPAVRLR
jgi:probable HAF family extracellular repeat protein